MTFNEQIISSRRDSTTEGDPRAVVGLVAQLERDVATWRARGRSVIEATEPCAQAPAA